MSAFSLKKFSRSILFKLLNKIEDGKIILSEDKHEITFGDKIANSGDGIVIYIRNPDAYSKMLFGGSVGAGKSFMDGDWDTNNLVNLIEVFIKNANLFYAIETPMAKLFNFIASITNKILSNNIKRAKDNIRSHYDLGNDFFELFLDPSMMYSCALYEPENINLADAAQHKIKTICEQLELKKTDHLLEIGSGWGGFAIYAAQHYGCKITTTTISDKQLAYVKNKISQLGLEHQIEVLNLDYRHLQGSYDKIVSIEMIEAVGHQYFDLFFRVCDRLLKPDGLFFLQAIVINDRAFASAKNEIDFIKKYIFPGGCLPSMHAITTSIATQTNLQLQAFKDIGGHYVKTLQDWQVNLLEKRNLIYSQGFTDEFIRMWQFYFCYCIAGFATGYISDIHALWRKRI